MKHSSGASALAGNAAKAAPHVTGEVYGRLINLSGRRRFTSQRVVLFAVLASQGRTEALQASRSALATFMEAHTALMEGNADLPGIFCDELHEAYYGADGADITIRAFIAHAERTHHAIESRIRMAATLLDELIDSATPLLAALNSVTQVYEDLARRQAARARKQLVDMMGDIQSIAKQARIVSFNAQIIASRAQASGREFAVVAAELSDITGRIDELVREAVRSSVS
ncbi:MAG: methyl-accepting chemotaxis protein [Betaproteobacteria bacterium]|nr:MAG: methyl-accepting chemotaxis protein [Betaproteobacteria bacterium]